MAWLSIVLLKVESEKTFKGFVIQNKVQYDRFEKSFFHLKDADKKGFSSIMCWDHTKYVWYTPTLSIADTYIIVIHSWNFFPHA